MKFRKITNSRVKSIDLVLNGILKPSDEIKKGDIVEIPDDNQILIKSMQIDGNYEQVIETPVKKNNKKKKVKED